LGATAPLHVKGYVPTWLRLVAVVVQVGDVVSALAAVLPPTKPLSLAVRAGTAPCSSMVWVFC
jgi:hypothetical protein